MNFKEALKLMKKGEKVKLPGWGGYWYCYLSEDRKTQKRRHRGKAG